MGKPSSIIIAIATSARSGERQIKRVKLKSFDKVFMPLKGSLIITL